MSYWKYTANATQRNATQRNATQRNATQRNAITLLTAAFLAVVSLWPAGADAEMVGSGSITIHHDEVEITHQVFDQKILIMEENLPGIEVPSLPGSYSASLPTKPNGCIRRNNNTFYKIGASYREVTGRGGQGGCSYAKYKVSVCTISGGKPYWASYNTQSEPGYCNDGG